MTGVILAGGKSRGKSSTDQSMLTFFGERLVERQIREMKKCCSEIILVTDEPRAFLPILGNSVRVITDYVPANGPLTGMYAAMSLSTYTNLWIVACNMPFISAEAATVLWRRKRETTAEAVFPVFGGSAHPLHGLYEKRSKDVLTDLLQQGKTQIGDLLRALSWEGADESCFQGQDQDGTFVRRLQGIEDYKRALALIDQTERPRSGVKSEDVDPIEK